MSHTLQRWLSTQLFDRVPCSLVVIDRGLTVIERNRMSVERFGEGRGRPCYELLKRRDAPCAPCSAARTFADGQIRVSGEAGVDRHGQRCHSVVHWVPVFDDPRGRDGRDGRDGRGRRVSHVVAMATDFTEVKRLKRDYDLLFEQAPCYLAVLNRDLRVVRANARFHATFGDTNGQHCYELLKRRGHRCSDCPAERTFADGGEHTAEHVGLDRHGDPLRYVVSSSAHRVGAGEVSYVLTVARDVVDDRELPRSHSSRNAQKTQNAAQLEPTS